MKDNEDNSLVKIRRVRAICDVLQSSRGLKDQDDSDSIPDFDLNQIDSGNIYE